jgi:hypothetical protein
MFQPWRMKVREAEEAFRGGRLEDARRVLQERGLLEFLPARRLMSQIAEKMAQRAELRLAGGATLAGWKDLVAAEQMGAEPKEVLAVKQQFIDHALAEATEYVQAGDPAAAVARLEELERQGATGRELRLMKEAARNVLAAQRLCHRGKFAQADEQLQAASALRPDWTALAQIRQACGDRGARTRELVERLHAALSAGDRTIVMAQAEAILDLCPDHEPALDARRRAWEAGGARLAASVGAPALCSSHHHANGASSPRSIPMNGAASSTENAQSPSGPRFVLWIDGVGGYLVCQGDVVTIGQPAKGSPIDIPILGDVSRLHATIHRDGEGYLIVPVRPTRVGGKTVNEPTSLIDGAEIELGQGVKMKFTMPNPLSRTAKLTFISRHRTSPTTDGVLLMAESCVLGPRSGAHVVCPDLTNDVVLFPSGDALQCRATGDFTVDGQPAVGRAKITRSSQVVGADFSLSLESI